MAVTTDIFVGPLAPVPWGQGAQWYDTTNHQQKTYNGSTWASNNSALYDAVWWGAKNDAATDDSVAVQNCITAALAANSEARFPCGLGYVINTAITIAGTNSLTITGGGKAGMSRFVSGPTLGSANMFNITNTSAHTWQNISFNGTLSTGKCINWTVSENSLPARFFNCTWQNFNSDYAVALTGTEDVNFFGCHINPGNNLSRKALYVSCPGGALAWFGGNIIGRTFLDVQTATFTGTTMGPVRGYNSNSLVTPNINLNGCYIYDSNDGSSGFPCIAGVSSGDVNGNMFYNLSLNGCWFIFGSQLTTTQNAISGNLNGTDIVANCCSWVQVVGSIATTVSLTRSGAGAGSVHLLGCNASYLGGVTSTAFNRAGGTAEGIVYAYIPSTLHPTAGGTQITMSVTLPTGTSAQNTTPTAQMMYVSGNTSTFTRLEISSDNSTFSDIWNSATATPAGSFLTFRWPAGVWARFTYTAGATPATCRLIPCP